MPLTPGCVLGPYEILAPLGAGGMGEVYRARHSRLEREIAVKVLPEHLSRDTEALARFEREVKTVAALNHPNILAIHDFANQSGTFYAVMELLDGETLRGRLSSAAMGWQKTVEIGVALAEGLSAAHATAAAGWVGGGVGTMMARSASWPGWRASKGSAPA